MDRNDLTLAVAAALVGAVLLGWILHMLFARLNTGAGPRSIKRTADMAHRLHDAEEAQHRAETRLRQVEGDLQARVTELTAELDASNAALLRAREQTEEIRAAYRQTMEARAPGTPFEP